MINGITHNNESNNVVCGEIGAFYYLFMNQQHFCEFILRRKVSLAMMIITSICSDYVLLTSSISVAFMFVHQLIKEKKLNEIAKEKRSFQFGLHFGRTRIKRCTSAGSIQFLHIFLLLAAHVFVVLDIVTCFFHVILLTARHHLSIVKWNNFFVILPNISIRGRSCT